MPTHAIEAFLFDLGGVLSEIDFDRAIAAWARYSPLPADVLRKRFKHDLQYERHERGEIPATEYFAYLATTLPERAAFDRVCALAGTSAASILFFDDLAENVQAAEDAGFQGVLVKTAEDVAAALRSFGLRCNAVMPNLSVNTDAPRRACGPPFVATVTLVH